VKSLPLATLLFLATFVSCSKDDDSGGTPKPPVVEPLERNPVAPGVIDAVSGIADSRLNPGFLWAHQDSQNPTSEVSLITHKGALQKRIAVKNAVNRDWEDMALAKGPDAAKFYVYIADIGDNTKRQKVYNIYRFPEVTQDVAEITGVEKIAFSYPDDVSVDAEAFIVDPESLDIFIIDASTTAANVYRLANPYSTTTTNRATLVATMPYGKVMSAAIRNDNKGIAVKADQNIYFYPRVAGESVTAVLAKTPERLYYEAEENGQAMTFKLDDSGYFTVGERAENAVTLNFYKK
jgi:hypothetical protein